MSKGAIGIVVLLIAAAMLISGCGEGSATSSEAELTKAEWHQKVEALCKKGGEKRGNAVTNWMESADKKVPTRADQEDLVMTALAPYKKMTAEIAALPLPKGEEAKAEAFIRALEEPIGRIEKDPGLAIDRIDLFNKGNAVAKKLKLEECLV